MHHETGRGGRAPGTRRGGVIRASIARVAALAALLLAPAALVAQDSTLTLEGAIRLALDRNERSLSADARLSAAEARVARARAYFFPSVTAAGTYTRRPEEVVRTINNQRVVAQSVDALSGTVTAGLTVFDSRSIPGVRQMRFDRNAERSATAESKRLLAFDVSQAYLATLGAEQVWEASRRRLEFARQSLEAARARYDAGLVSVNDVTRAELELATAEMIATQVRGRFETTRLQLAYFLDEPAAAAKRLVPPDFPMEAGAVDSTLAEELIAQARSRRLDLEELRWRARGQRALLAEPLLRWLPTLGLTSQYRYTNEAGLTGKTTTWNAGVSVSWPLFDGFARNADYGERKALARIADLEVSTALRAIEVEVREALVSLASQRATLREAEVAGGVARRNAAETAELYRQGLASALEAADANVRLFEAEVALVAERYGLETAWLDLEAALGLDPFGKEPQR